jgi:glycosyltransferase involved in cell wall biosynthesis
MGKYLEESGVYILPSKFKPWGVAVQEFAISGFPMTVSDQVGAKHAHLDDNGFDIKAGSVEALKETMLKILNKTNDKSIEMGLKSHELGTSFNNEQWVDNLIGIIRQWRN